MTPEMDRLKTEIERVFAADFAAGRLSSWGITNCRTKNSKPGAPYSEHSWGNAWDIRVLPISGAAGDRLAAWARKSPLVSETFWKVALHYDHVHVTAAPRRNYDNKQIPPCAGGKDEDMETVANIQKGLIEAGYDLGNYPPYKTGYPKGADGKWGAKTHAAFVAASKPSSGGVSVATFNAHTHDEGKTGRPL